VRPCRAKHPSARSQPLDRQSLTLNSSETFRVTLSHEGITHCDLSKLRARHKKRHMNEEPAKKGPEGALTRGNAAQTQFHIHLHYCLATPKQLLCLFPTPFSPTPQGGHHESPVKSPLRSFRHADHASGRWTSGTTARGFEPFPTLSSRAHTSFAPEESPASPSSA